MIKEKKGNICVDDYKQVKITLYQNGKEVNKIRIENNRAIAENQNLIDQYVIDVLIRQNKAEKIMDKVKVIVNEFLFIAYPEESIKIDVIRR